MKKINLFILLLIAAQLPAQKNFKAAEQIKPAVFSLSMVMMHDVVNPPAASRYYAYCLMGAYEIACLQDPKMIPLSRLVKSFPQVTLTAPKESYNYQAAAVYCIYETGRLMLPSGFTLEQEQDKYIRLLRKNKLPQKVIEQSVAVAKEVAQQVAGFSKKDNYNRLSARLRYTPVKGDAYWYPTPPAYMEAVEPNWKTVKPLLIDSCNEFIPIPPVTFSKDTASEFYKLGKEVYDVSLKPTQEQLNIAGFWDCNPFAVSSSGHMALGFKKISPGGHWMNITSIAAEKAALDFNKSIAALTIEGAVLMDAFISCWDEKYRSNRIRPETYINRYINPKWQPLLQTPPFPEYTSGHSVISTASAEVLTYLFGDNFTYTDNSEEMFELAPRSFSSFRHAANEAAISRLYGGIHYRDAIENGQQQGRAIGNHIVTKIKQAGVTPLL
ncbi:vanadium-dependent haloperoxidase [Foetidibacter luteolus]|uniref:vanadium-dependent haloperoxidase n=1 Tax=Foetidibacter luteolus TaxID=2608880 RepID=UPI00129AE410|nr:vanadium-dependent haloperoxidase [Foetidibacter luteolus]